MIFLGVSRSAIFSPHSEERDAAIFSAVVDGLKDAGHTVQTISEDKLKQVPTQLDGVFTMSRSKKALQLLKVAETRNIPIFNSPKSLLENTRTKISELFDNECIPTPRCYSITRAGLPSLSYPFWIKRGDACAQDATDVCFVTSKEEYKDALLQYEERNVTNLLAVEHLEGDLVKFYGVEGTNFFFSYYPTLGQQFSKFGLEEINGLPKFFPFEASALKQEADRAARLTGFVIYGGDCVISADGSFKIIDFNDWPSFSLCRELAARAIVERIISSYGR